MEDFRSAEIEVDATRIFARWAGRGPPLLLLHGFPQTHLMWRRVAPLLARRFTVVCADLRGYGRSGCPPSAPGHEPYSKRALARDMVQVMEQLGFGRFALAGHDRGGRVAYRLALDHPQRVERLAVLDIVPTSAAWDRADGAFALGYWPWSLLAQPEPLPERLIGAAPDAIVDAALGGWGSPAGVFDAWIRAQYIDALRDAERVHAICEEYRAAASLDREHDAADRRGGRRIRCPVLALWSGAGPLASWYAAEGGPLALWHQCCDDVTGRPLAGGHFFPEANPGETARLLTNFFLGFAQFAAGGSEMAEDSLPQVGAPVPELKTSPILDPTQLQEAPTPPAFGLAEGVCYFNGQSYPVGTYVQSGSEVLQCTKDGVWAHKGERQELVR